MKKIVIYLFVFSILCLHNFANAKEAYEPERKEQLLIEEELYTQEIEYAKQEKAQEEFPQLQELSIEEEPSNIIEFSYTEGSPIEATIIFEEIVLDNIDSNWYIETKPTATKVISPNETQAPIETILAYKDGYSTLLQPDATIYGLKEFSYGNALQYNNSKLGVKYENKVTPENFEQIRTLYYEYQRNKFFINAAYKSSSTDFRNKKQTGKIKVENSYKLTDSLALKYVYTSGKKSTDSDILLTIYPSKNDSSINFDIGAGQKFYPDREEYSSRFLFETEFNF